MKLNNDGSNLAEVLEESAKYWKNEGGSIANLSGANLSGANLSDANLSGAHLSRANLSHANLSRANLSRANLSHANLNRANLNRANLSHANLNRADLSGTIGITPITKESIALVLKIAEIVIADNTKLQMRSVHSCGAAHCGAGWVCTLNPLAGALERIIGWNAAACLTTPIPEFTSLFFATDAEMLAFLRTVSDDGGQALRDKYLTNATILN
jgi:uncharacterized protein YjbI with pentapeptide repeats